MGLLESHEGDEVKKEEWSPEDGDPFLGYGGDGVIRNRLRTYGLVVKMAKDKKEREDREKIQTPPFGDVV